jgi:hypothetical protein
MKSAGDRLSEVEANDTNPNGVKEEVTYILIIIIYIG